MARRSAFVKGSRLGSRMGHQCRAIFIRHRGAMPSMSGHTLVIIGWTIPALLGTSPRMSSVMKISTNTASGATHQLMVMSGCRAVSTQVGHRIAMATGFGSILGDGPGLRMSLGAMLRSTTDAGSTTITIGDGRPDRSMFARITLPHWSRGSEDQDGAWALVSVAATAMAGARLVSVNRSFRGMA